MERKWTDGSRSCHRASRIIGPVAVGPDDAPLDAPAHADDRCVLADRVVQRAPYPVRGEYDRAAKAPRDGLRCPGPEGGLADILESRDFQIGVPEAILLAGEPFLDALENVGVLAGGKYPVVARA